METNYHELIDLIHIPEINLEVAALLDDLEKKQALAAINLEFENKWRYYLETLYLSQKDLFKDQNEFAFRWFELIRTDNWKWELRLIYPHVKFEFFPDMLPDDIMRQITDTLVNPDHVVTMNGIQSELDYVMMDLEFVHFSSTYIFGTFKHYFLKESLNFSTKRLSFKKLEAKTLKLLLALKDIFPQQIDQWLKNYLTTVPPIALSRHKRKGVYDLVNIPLRNKQNPLNELKNFPLNLGENVKTCGIQRLIKMIMIPGVNERLMLKWQEIKEGYHKKAIEAYRINKERLYKYMFTDRKLKRNTFKDSPQLYWFELTSLIPDHWEITALTPDPPIYESVADILPAEFFDLIQFAKPDGQVIKCMYTFKQPSWRKLDIWWIRYSHNCVMGSVCEYTGDLDQLRESYNALLKGDTNINREHLHRLFIYHVRSHLGL